MRTTKFLFFWGHQPQRDGSIGPGRLSQWWPAVFTLDGREYATAEHWMMWSKAMLFDDTHPQQWLGLNLLGQALMDARSFLREHAG